MQRNTSVMLFIGLTIVFTVIGQLLVKRGMLNVGSPPADGSLAAYIWRALTSAPVILGLSCAVAAALTWMVALSRADLSFAYPFMGLAIVLVLALTPLVFGEKVPLTRWLGVLVVCVGLWIASRNG